MTGSAAGHGSGAVWLNGRLVPPDEALVSVFDHGFTVGDGVFETLKVIGGRAFGVRRTLNCTYSRRRAHRCPSGASHSPRKLFVRPDVVPSAAPSVCSRLSIPVLRSTASTDVTAPIPTIGVVGRGYIVPIVSIGGEFSGLKLGPGEDEIKFFDFDINGIVSIGRHVGAQVGYRSVIADYLVDEDSGELKMKGLYFGGVVRF